MKHLAVSVESAKMKSDVRFAVVILKCELKVFPCPVCGKKKKICEKSFYREGSIAKKKSYEILCILRNLKSGDDDERGRFYGMIEWD